jgi:hypothetical protein
VADPLVCYRLSFNLWFDIVTLRAVPDFSSRACTERAQ